MITLKNGVVLQEWQNELTFPFDVDYKREFKDLSDFPEWAYGFVYRIHFTTKTGRNYKYIGCKRLTSTRKRNFGKKELAQITDKRLKTYEMVTKESDWRKYYSSNKTIKEIVKSENVKFIFREVIDIARSKRELTYLETQNLFNYEVLKSDDYLNDNILGKFYSKDFRDGEA